MRTKQGDYKDIEKLTYDWDEVGSSMLERAVSKINELVDVIEEMDEKIESLREGDDL